MGRVLSNRGYPFLNHSRPAQMRNQAGSIISKTSGIGIDQRGRERQQQLNMIALHWRMRTTISVPDMYAVNSSAKTEALIQTGAVG